MERITLAQADLSHLTHEQIVQHIVDSYQEPAENLQGIRLIVAYEHVGSWGCDSSSFFLFEKGGKLYEVNGGHCSCYGFENQWCPEETSREALLARPQLFYGGGYDDERKKHAEEAKAHIAWVIWSA